MFRVKFTNERNQDLGVFTLDREPRPGEYFLGGVRSGVSHVEWVRRSGRIMRSDANSMTVLVDATPRDPADRPRALRMVRAAWEDHTRRDGGSNLSETESMCYPNIVDEVTSVYPI